MIKLHCQKWPSHSFLLMTKEEKHLEEQPLLQLSLCQNCPKLFLITSKPDDEGGKASPWTEKLVPQALLLQLSSSKRLLKLPQTCQTTCQTCQKTLRQKTKSCLSHNFLMTKGGKASQWEEKPVPPAPLQLWRKTPDGQVNSGPMANPTFQQYSDCVSNQLLWVNHAF